MSYRNIDAHQVVTTLSKLHARIDERFPKAGLANVCVELVELANNTREKVQQFAKPILPIRIGVACILLLGLGLALYGVHLTSLENKRMELFSFVSGLESAVNLILVVGTGIFVLTNYETRFKRHTALNALHELRSIIHVIDMHQLTKDPAMLGAARTSSSPDHSLSPFELVRYLDYCSEMLSLTGKLAALYAQDFNDSEIVDAASDIEQLATNLSQKVWQKITIIQVSGH